ncbi:MAG: ABC transporter substrate-binding protein [Luteococcus sp.]|uniref:ABC transporter substrate-binding protein n=1 Tax=Luteococcus sp. TaxID=1969402 RepID=UPI002647F709|nr:ABC transporter substrate-binding protein [Luteococcus sp.]MDN5563776.1 ABC transporter substrate-binding protein [Luteococcus sp.]
MATTNKAQRVAFAGLSVIAVLATAACGGGDKATSGESTAALNWDQKGPITFVQGKDNNNLVQPLLNEWNKEHPNEKVTFVQLSASADEQRQKMVDNANTKGASNYDVLYLDIVWTAEFAAKQWVHELPKDMFPTDGMLQPAVDGATYFDKLYAYPTSSDGAMLYFRKDLLEKAGIKEAPKTWSDMKAACTKVKALPEGKGLDCYGGQFQKYEGLTCNITEIVNSSGAEFLDKDGKPQVNSEAALKGVQWLQDSFKDGTIPKAATTWMEEPSRQAFQDGKLVFLRQWPYIYSLMQAKDGSSKVADKFGIAPLPGLEGPGVSTLGGHNLAISKTAKNLGTARDFIKWYGEEAQQKTAAQKATLAPTRESLYADADLVKQLPYLPVLKESIATAKARPKVVAYNDATQAIQDASANVIAGKDPKSNFEGLQTKLTELTK